MTFAELLVPDAVIPAFSPRPKLDVVAALATALAARDPQLQAVEVSAALLRRERIASTALRDGIAVPHARMAGITQPVVVLARCPVGLDYLSVDGRLTHLLFAAVTPAESNDHLKILSRAARVLGDETFREQIMRAADGNEIYDLLCMQDTAAVVTGTALPEPLHPQARL